MDMNDSNEYLKKLGHHIQAFIVNNKMQFGESELFKVISNICIIEDLLYRNSYIENDLSKRLANISAHRNNVIFSYMNAAEKFLPGLCYFDMESDINNRIVNWTFENNAQDNFISFNKRYYDLDVSGLCESYF